MRWRTLCVGGLLVTFALTAFSHAETKPGEAKPAATLDVLSLKDAGEGFPAGVQRLEYRSSADKAQDWAMLLPPAGASHTWAIYLHGHGSGGEQLFSRPDVRDGVLAAVRKQGWGAVGPNLRGNAWMSPAAADDLHALIQLLRTRFNAERIVLIGASMGGSGVLAYTAVHPEDPAAVIALCPAADIGGFHGWCRGRKSDAAAPPVLQELADAIESAYGGPPSARGDVYAAHSALAHARQSFTMPMFVSHGSVDAVISVEQARRLAEILRDRPTFQYHELSNAGHEGPIGDMPAAMKFILPQLEKAGRG